MKLKTRRAESEDDRKEIDSLFRALGIERNWDVETVIDLPPENCLDVVAHDEDGRMVAALRLIYRDVKYFPINKKEGWPNLLLESDGSIGEVALSVVVPDCRGDNSVFLSLYCQMYWEAKTMGISRIYAILDSIIFLLYKRVGFRFIKIEASEGGGEKLYWGETTFPAFLDLEDTYSFIRERKANLWQILQQTSPLIER